MKWKCYTVCSDLISLKDSEKAKPHREPVRKNLVFFDENCLIGRNDICFFSEKTLRFKNSPYI